MAIIDAKLRIANGQDPEATEISEDVLDFGAADAIGFGSGSQIRAVFLVENTMLRTAGAATLTISIRTHTAADVTSGTVLALTEAIDKAALVAGYRREFVIPKAALSRYVGALFTISTDFDAGGGISMWFEAL